MFSTREVETNIELCSLSNDSIRVQGTGALLVGLLSYHGVIVKYLPVTKFNFIVIYFKVCLKAQLSFIKTVDIGTQLPVTHTPPFRSSALQSHGYALPLQQLGLQTKIAIKRNAEYP